MGFTQYLKRVLFRDSSGNGYVIPITNTKVRYEPWHATGQTSIRLFHGKNVRRIQGYQGFCEFDMNFNYEGVDDATLSSFINAISSNTNMTIDFDPDVDPGNKIMTVILDDVRGNIGASFTGKIRNRRVRLKFIDPVIRATIPSWIVGKADSPLLDPVDLILLLPDELTASGTNLTLWNNLGTIGDDGDIDTAGVGGTPSNVAVVSPYGIICGFTSNNEDKKTSSTAIVPTIDDVNDDSEMWIVVRTTAGGDIGEIAAFSTGGGAATRWQHSGNKFTFAVASVERFVNCPANYGNTNFHVFRTIHSLSTDSLIMEVDGYPLDSVPYTGAMTHMNDGNFTIGPGNTGTDTGYAIALVKLLDGILSRGRSRAIYAYLRDTWLITDIPVDGTAVVGIVGSPLGQADIQREPFLAGSAASTLHNGGSTSDLGYTIRKDDTNQYIYYMEGHSAVGRLWRAGYSGDNQTLVTSTRPSGGLAKGLAINLSVANECYATNGANGNTLNQHSLDPADSADAWTELIATGTYEMHMAVEYHPANDLIYFIDSLAATPTLRSVTTAGGSDTLVKSLTAGKVYEYLCKDPDANVLYFTNATDNTIEKYDIGTDTHTTAWHTPTNKPNGIDIQNSLLWYYEETTFKIYEVALSTPGSKTEKGDVSSLLPGDAGGLIVIVFDTTA